MAREILDELERQLDKLPSGSLKHDMEPGFDAMAEWIQKLDAERLVVLEKELPAWLNETGTWHARAVMEIALRVGDDELLQAAVKKARTDGVQDLPEVDEYPAWLLYQLNLLSVISRWPIALGTDALAYLDGLRTQAPTAASYSRRLLASRAWLTECSLLPPAGRRRCLQDAMEVLRGWQNGRLLRSALTLLHAYFGSTEQGVVELRQVLTSHEFDLAFPELAG